MGNKTSDKFNRSVDYFINGIDPQGEEIYTYARFTNLIRAKIKSHMLSNERMKLRKERQKKEASALLKELEGVK